jgi:hypothetical protein
MLSILTDIVTHAQPVGVLNMLRLTHETDGVSIDSVSEDLSLILLAKTHETVPDFTGVFGIADLGKLAYLVKNNEYREDAKITIKSEERNGVVVPVYAKFENKAGDFTNTYRFVNKNVLDEKLKKVEFKGAKWNLEFTPSLASINRLKNMAGAHTGETFCQLKVKDGNLVFYFGDATSHAGEFVFEPNIEGTTNNNFYWPISHLLSILQLDGDKQMYITDSGAIKITVDSQLIKYDFIIPAAQK